MSSDDDSTVNTPGTINPSDRSSDATRSLTETELRAIFAAMSREDLDKYSGGINLPGTVTVHKAKGRESVSAQSSLESLAEERDKMERYYEAKALVEERSGHVWKSITDCLKDQVFSMIKFWTDTDSKFLQPDFRESVETNKKEQARRICELILKFLNRPQDSGANYSLKLMVKFWKAYSKDIREELVRYRANATAEAKKMYITGK